MPRGKHIEPYRAPGFLIKELLTSEGPLNPSELHRRYKARIKDVNAARPKKERVKGMTYWSFAKYCQFAKWLGLIEEHHEEPLEDTRLLSIRDHEVVPSARVYYSITPKGRAEELAWANLRRAAAEELGW